MTQEPPDYAQQLRSLIQAAQIPSFRALQQTAQVSEWQIKQLKQGKAAQMRVEVLAKLSCALKVSLVEMLDRFSSLEPLPHQPVAESEPGAALIQMKQEYERLQHQLETQKTQLLEEFQRNGFNTLENLLTFLPSAIHAAQQNPDLPATRLIPLLRPIDQLLQQWGIEAIAPIGSEVPYDPQWHKLDQGQAQPGDPVRVRHAGYRQLVPASTSASPRLLLRATVTPLP